MFRRPVTLRRINALLIVGYLAWMGLPPAAAAKQLWILSGTVLDGLGRPLAGARVSLADLPTSAEQGRRGVEGAAMDSRLQVATDSAGRFAVEIGTPTLLTVTVSAAGFLAMRLGPFAETRSVELPPLVLSRSEIASVLLVDSAGEPVSGRRVAARSSVKSAAAPGWRPAPRHYRSDRRGEILLQRRPGEELELQLTDRALASYGLPRTSTETKVWLP